MSGSQYTSGMSGLTAGKFRKPIVKPSNIVDFADSLARSIRANYRWSEQLRNSVVLGKPSERNGNLSIMIIVGAGTDKSKNSLSGMARAYEYGSGIHATRGKRGTYIIESKTGGALAFKWDKGAKNIKALTRSLFSHKASGTYGKYLGRASDGRLMFAWVDHPGVKKRGDIQKSIDNISSKPEYKKLATEVRVNVAEILNLTIREINARAK